MERPRRRSVKIECFGFPWVARATYACSQLRDEVANRGGHDTLSVG